MNRIFNVIGWVGAAFVAAAFAIRLGFPNYEQYAFYLAWAGLVCVLLYMASQWREMLAMFGRRQAKYGAVASASVFVVLGILVAVNYIGKRQNKRWDFTSTKQFSLSDQTRNILQKLDAPLQIRVFVTDQAAQPYKERLKEYEYVSKQLSIEYIDPEKKRPLATENQITTDGTVIFDYKGRSERVTSNSEQDITNGIIKVVTGKEKKVYFTQGHGEKDTAGSGRTSYAAVADALKRENYTVEKVALAQQGAVPDDAAVVVVAGPTADFLAPEIDALKKYLEKSGKLLLALDPPEKSDAPPLSNLIALAHEWGIQVGTDVVVDVSGMGKLFGASEAVPIAVNYPPHPITERFNVMTAYPLARSVTPVSGGVNGHVAQPLVETGPRSWAEADLKNLFAAKPVDLNPETGDKPGPIQIAAAVAAPAAATPPDQPPAEGSQKQEARMVVFGDSDFAGDASSGALSGNRDLFMNSIGWLSQQENLISIRPKEASDRRLMLTEAQQTNLWWISLLGIPMTIFGMGVYTWWRRR